MNQSQDTQKNGNKTQKPELDPETIKAIVAQQSEKLKLEAQKIRLEEKRLDQNGILAEKSLQFNSEIIKNTPQNSARQF